jgi:hypothetical protein
VVRALLDRPQILAPIAVTSSGWARGSKAVGGAAGESRKALGVRLPELSPAWDGSADPTERGREQLTEFRRDAVEALSASRSRDRRVVVTRVAGSVEFPAGFTLSDLTLGILPPSWSRHGVARAGCGSGSVWFSSRP